MVSNWIKQDREQQTQESRPQTQGELSVGLAFQVFDGGKHLTQLSGGLEPVARRLGQRSLDRRLEEAGNVRPCRA